MLEFVSSRHTRKLRSRTGSIARDSGGLNNPPLSCVNPQLEELTSDSNNRSHDAFPHLPVLDATPPRMSVVSVSFSHFAQRVLTWFACGRNSARSR